jgi:polyhydroxyalkanoate synthesis regulator phasin
VRAKRGIAIGGLAASLLGGGAAVAARSGDDGDKTEQAILSDAAKRLGVSADELESALAKAEDAQLDQAVKNGDLTKEQADAIKKHRKSDGRVLGVPGGPMGGPGFGLHRFHEGGGPRFGGPGGVLDAVADELGISVEKLFSELRDGKSLEQVAKAHDKSLDDLKEAAKDVLSKRLDAAVKQGHLTRSQADEILDRLPDLIDHLGDKGPGGPGGRPGFGPPPGNGEGAGSPPRWQ